MKINKNLSSASDLALFDLAKNNNDDDALNVLYKRYTRIGRKLAAKAFIDRHYGEEIIEEYIPEIDFVFLTSFRKYSSEKGTFYSYFKTILYNNIKRYIGRVILTNDLLRDCASLDDAPVDSSGYEAIPDKRVIPPGQYSNIDDFELNIASPSRRKRRIDVSLAKKAIILRYLGYSNVEISRFLNINRNRLTRLFRILSCDLEFKIH